MRRRDERGAVVPVVALLLTVLLGITALTVDIGMQRVARSDMQAIADMVALDLARELNGRPASAIQPGLQAAADRSLARNEDAVGTDVDVDPELGILADDGSFTPVSGATVPDAVRVTATTSVDFSFRPGSGGAGRTAVASSSSTACFQLGSYVAALTSDSASSTLLNSLLAQVDAAYDIGAVGYTGLLDAEVSLLDLATELGMGSTSELAATSVAVDDFYAAMAEVLSTDGNTLDAAVLQAMAAGVGSLEPVAVGDLVEVVQGGGSAVSADVRVLDLLVGSAFLVHDGSALTIPSLTSDVLGLGGVTTSLEVVQGAQLACSEANPSPLVEATTAQVSASVTGTVPSTPVTDPVLNLVDVEAASQAGAPATATLALARARGHLTAITCATPASATAGMDVATQSGLLSASLEVPTRVTGGLDIGGVGLVTFTITTTLGVDTSSAPAVGSASILIPPSSYGTPVSSGTGSLALAGLSVSTAGTQVEARLLGLSYSLSTARVDAILAAAATAVVTPLVNTLDAALVSPLADLVGLRVAGADVIALPEPACATPALRG